ncbi:nucleotidyltransferase family protein [Sphingomonas hankyongi]|uniref:Nucleotidyltransferase family protein n=1 Tax=Sphingomonas hankyongi TaxID=2908209 RepID=A0ABT0S2N6_9SPHN|nr:nucleotidyltransferase family protein [Sphingomonas hankyongi]MCL6730135.1 nucleotidyltransferase family protein [Sphingomonas hankyongi]
MLRELTGKDQLLADLIAGRGYPSIQDEPCPTADLVKAVRYHGIAGLLHERSTGSEGPSSSFEEELRNIALSQAMWELRHRAVLGRILEEFDDRGIRCLLLKGTALAYDLYDNPAQRARGDTDLLVEQCALTEARRVFQRLGFQAESEEPGLPEVLRGQESWLCRADDGSVHSIDLHWRVLNAPALHGAFPFETLWSGRRALTKLSRAAFAPARSILLAHACVHRALHDCSPYYVGADVYFGGNRLIWLWDLLLLGRSLTPPEWEEVVELAKSGALGDVIVDGLMAAQARFGSFCPAHVQERLRRAGPNRYFRRGQLGRAAMDWWAVRGPQRKAQYALAKLLPSRQFMQAKYPSERDKPLPLLYLRRVRELIRHRPTGANAG